LKLAQEQGKLSALPLIRSLKPSAPRSGFIERGELEAICRELPENLQLVVRIGHTFGWRVTSEVLLLTKAQLDMNAGTLRLEPGTTKNRDGRFVYLTDDLRTALVDQLANVRTLERQTSRVIPWVFPHLEGRFKGEKR